MTTSAGRKRQERLLAFLIEYQARTGFWPTLRECAKAIEVVSVSTVSNHLDTLVQLGVIERHTKLPRAFRVLRTTLPDAPPKMKRQWAGSGTRKPAPPKAQPPATPRLPEPVQTLRTTGEPCDECDGVGIDPIDMSPCPICRGSGKVLILGRGEARGLSGMYDWERSK